MADEIIKVLDDLAQRMGVVIDWSAENVLPYVTELGEKLVRYELLTSVFWTLFPVLFGVVIWKFMKWATTQQKVEYEHKDRYYGDTAKKTKIFTPIEDSFVVMVLGIFMLVFELLLVINVVVCEIETVLAAVALPEKIIMEYLQTLM